MSTPEHGPDDPFAAEGFTPLEVPIPPRLAETFGYRSNARFVGFHWEPAGDEVVYDDGMSSGTGESWAFLAFRRHPAVAPHLQPYNLGYSDLEAGHCLLLDREKERAAVSGRAAARSFLRDQHPSADLSPYEIEEARRALEEVLDTAALAAWQETRIDPEAIRRAMAEQREAVRQMLEHLNRAQEN